MSNEQIIFLQAFERLLTQKLQRFRTMGDESHGVNVLDAIYKVIEDTTFEQFKNCEFDLADASKRFVAERMFAGLMINGLEDMMQSHEHAKRTNVRDIPNSDLRLLLSLFGLAAMAEELSAELKRRN